jgi:hypothetical protein
MVRLLRFGLRPMLPEPASISLPFAASGHPVTDRPLWRDSAG